MIVGNGLMAKRFGKYRLSDEIIIFASGVANSKETETAAFEREKTLLTQTIAQNKGKKLVYFSTCSIADPSVKDSPYVKHKLACEELIKSQISDYLIFRVSNVVGTGGNPNTIINFLVHKIKSQAPFQIWKNSVRNLIDVDDVFILSDHYISYSSDSKTINIANPQQYGMSFIVKTIEKFLNKKGNYNIENKGEFFEIDVQHIQSLAAILKVNFDANYYLKHILEKYFSE